MKLNLQVISSMSQYVSMSYMIIIFYEHFHCNISRLAMQMSIFHQDLLWFFCIVSITCFVQLRSLPEISSARFIAWILFISSRLPGISCHLPTSCTSWVFRASLCYLATLEQWSKRTRLELLQRPRDFWTFDLFSLFSTWMYVSGYVKNILFARQ